MTNDQFLKLFQKTLFDLSYFDSLKTIKDLQIASADFDDSVWWNNATIDTPPPSLQTVSEVEAYFSSIDRHPVFYFAQNPQNQPFEQLLTNSGYHQTDYEVWLQIKNPQIDTAKFHQIKLVRTTKDLETFIATIDKGYGADDPDNPYGGLGSYPDQIRKSFSLHGPDSAISHYVLFDELNAPASVGSLTNYDSIGYISNLATIPEKRKLGYSRALLNYFLHLSVQNGNQTHCLATEVGSTPNKIYQHLGFTEMFRAKYYTKHHLKT